MLLLIDNYDSFTYNLFQYLSELGAEVEVVRNDKATVEELDMMQPELVVVSPGPSNPDKAGVSVDAIRHFAGKVPVLGVCLGHQCIGAAYGGVVRGAGEIRHGKTSLIYHDGKGIFKGVPDPFEAVRYHSLAIEKGTVPPEFEVSAHTENGIIMGIRHKTLPIEGVQFHPESILTKPGKQILQNFLDLAKKQQKVRRRRNCHSEQSEDSRV
jgi:anthranilate synthase/aminodeoxychorismate synthase-like glutamine amidotransferase